MQEPQETWVWSLGQEDPLEEEMATYSSNLTEEIAWTEQTGSDRLWWTMSNLLSPKKKI